jgi:hypothetical protein
MTISLAVIARLPEREAVAISYSKKGSISEANPFNKEIATPEP